MSSSPKPNVLLIVVDSMRADHLSCYGYHRETTPNIDKLADEGCLFETAITAAPFSPASYASLFSNLYPHQHGVNGDTVRVWPDGFTRLAERMKEHGYVTFGISSNDFVSSACNSVRGFDEFVDAWTLNWLLRQHARLHRVAGRRLGQGVARWLQPNSMQCAAKGDAGRTFHTVKQLIRRHGQPFFGFIVLMEPHAPFNARHRYFLESSNEARRFFRDINLGRMWVKCTAQGHGLAPEQFRVAMDCYDSAIRYADKCIGRFCEELREQQLLDDTIVAITADHGEGFGEHGVWGHGFDLTDPLTRVPLVIRCPRYWGGGLRSGALVQLHDLHELCLSVAQSGEPRSDLYPHCLTQAGDGRWTGRDVAYSEFPTQTKTLQLFRKLNARFEPGEWAHNAWAVRSREWRYIEYDNGKCRLYDLIRDPKETEPVHERHPEVCQELRALLVGHKNDRPHEVDDVASARSDDVDAAVLDRLRALGYIE